MPFVLLTFLALLAYVCGLIIIVKMTPRLLARAFDEGIFVGYAAADVFAGIFIFGAVATPLTIFSTTPSAVFGARVFAFFLLVGILVVVGRTALYCFRTRRNAIRISRIFAGSYCLLLCVAALFCIVLLFQPIT